MDRDNSKGRAPLDVALAAALDVESPDTQVLAGLEQQFSNSGLFLHVAAEAAQQQEWFWSRFSAFTAIHAGLFAFSGVTKASRTLLVIGCLLAVGWVAIQGLSLSYVNKSKTRLHGYERIRGLRASGHGTAIRRPTSTEVGFFVSVAILIAWAVMLLQHSH